MILSQNIHKSFGKTQALDDISFEIQKGEIVGFLGQNGAGKTTLMRILTTYLSASSGRVLIAGEDAAKKSISIRRKIGYLPETPPLYDHMRVKEYLRFSAQLKDVAARRIALEVDRVLSECDLQGAKDQVIGILSKGYRQRIGIAQAIIHNPQILILDEPTNGLDPVQIQHVRRLIKSVERKFTVLVSTHVLSEIEQLAQRVLIIKSGKIVLDSPMAKLLAEHAQQGRKNLEQAFLNIVGANTEEGA